MWDTLKWRRIDLVMYLFVLVIMSLCLRISQGPFSSKENSWPGCPKLCRSGRLTMQDFFYLWKICQQAKTISTFAIGARNQWPILRRIVCRFFEKNLCRFHKFLSVQPKSNWRGTLETIVVCHLFKNCYYRVPVFQRWYKKKHASGSPVESSSFSVIHRSVKIFTKLKKMFGKTLL